MANALIYTRQDALQPIGDDKVGWLRSYARQLGWTVTEEILQDDGHRWDEVRSLAHAGKFQVLVVWSADHIDPTAYRELYQKLVDLQEWKIGVWSCQEPFVRTVGEQPIPYLVEVLTWAEQMDARIRSVKAEVAVMRGKAVGRRYGRLPLCATCGHGANKHPDRGRCAVCGVCLRYIPRPT